MWVTELFTNPCTHQISCQVMKLAGFTFFSFLVVYFVTEVVE